MKVQKEKYVRTPIVTSDSLKSKELSFKSTQFVQKYLKTLPKDVRDIFTPVTEDELLQLELRLAHFGKIQKDKVQVMQLQKQFNLAFRPNMTLRDTIIRVKIEFLRRKKRAQYNETLYNPEQDDIGSF